MLRFDFTINQKIKTIIGFDSFDYLVIYFPAIYLSCHSITPAMREMNQIIKYIQRILIFDFISFPWTDRPTFALIEASCQSLTMHTFGHCPKSQ